MAEDEGYTVAGAVMEATRQVTGAEGDITGKTKLADAGFVNEDQILEVIALALSLLKKQTTGAREALEEAGPTRESAMSQIVRIVHDLSSAQRHDST